MSDQGSKTEPATPRQRQRARQRGQVARSVELVSVFLLFSVLLMVFCLDRYYGGKVVDLFRQTVGHADEYQLTGEYLPIFIRDMVTATLVILAPFLLASLLVALGLNLFQVGFAFSSKPLEPDLGRLNPMKGFQRIFSMRALVDLLKNLLKLLIVGVVGFSLLYRFAPGLVTAQAMLPEAAVAYAKLAGLRIALTCTALLLVLAILDYLYQRYEFEKSIMMSKQEIKDEYKNMEGDPMIKRRIREMGRRLALSRLTEQIKTADAVITNPTHYAVALRYELDWPAPKVVAKGKDYMALRLIRYAEELGLPVYQQAELARALYQVELDQHIPAGLFKAVARVLAHLSKLDRRLRSKLRGLKVSAAAR